MDLGATKDHGLLRGLSLHRIAQRVPWLFRLSTYFRAHDNLGQRTGPAVAATLAAFFRERGVVAPCERQRPRLIGGFSGRSGTTWLEQVLRYSLYGKASVIGERHLFWKHEFSVGPQTAASIREPALRLKQAQQFQRYLLTDGFNPRVGAARRITFGGLGRLLPRSALARLAHELCRALAGGTDPWRAYGDFYRSLFATWTQIAFGRELPWISKEPAYGESVDRVFQLMPDARLVVLVRDGRDVALSAVRAGWSAGLLEAAERWAEGVRPAMEAIGRAPEGSVLIVRFEELCAEFDSTMARICGFLELPIPERFYPRPVAERSAAWRQVLSAEDCRAFSERHGELLLALGYPAG